MVANARGIRAGRAYVELGVSDRLGVGLARARRRLRAFGAAVTGIGLKTAAIGASMMAPLLLAARSFAKMGDDLAKMAKRTGLSVEALSELQYAAKISGANLEGLEKVVRRMQRSIYDLGRDLSTQVDGFADLGLTYKDLAGLKPEAQFMKIAEAISRVPDPTRKAALAMALFGRSGTQLLPLFNTGAKGIAKLRAEAHRLGITLSAEDAAAAEEFTDKMTVMWMTVKRATFAIGKELAPVLGDFAQQISQALRGSAEWIRQNRGVVVSLLKLTAATMAAGAALVVLGTVAKVTAAAFAILSATMVVTKAIMLAIASPIALVLAGVAALGVGIMYWTGASQKALAWLGEGFRTLKDDAVAAYQGIADALASGNIGLAAKILWLTLRMEFERGIAALQTAWLNFKHYFIRVAYGAWYGAVTIAQNVWHGLKVAWIELSATLAKVWAGFVGFFSRTWEGMKSGAAKAWTWIKGLFTQESDRTQEMAYKAIDARRRAAISQIDNEERREAAAAEADRLGRRERADREHAAAEAGLAQEWVDADSQLKAAQESAITAATEDLAAARAEWTAAIGDAATGRRRFEAEPEGPTAPVYPEPPDYAAMSDGGAESARRVSTFGTFNAAVIGQMGPSRLATRTAIATEASAEKLRSLDRKIKGAAAFE